MTSLASTTSKTPSPHQQSLELEMLFNRYRLGPLLTLFLLVGALLPMSFGFPLNASNNRSDVAISINSTTMLTPRRLMPRQCLWDPDEARFICDEFLPSLKEIVDRLHDTGNEGLIDSDHNVAFFTGLDLDMVETGKLIAGWFASQSTNEPPLRYCWFPDCIERLWMQETKRWIEKNIDEQEAPTNWGTEPEQSFIACYMQALAVATINPDVYLFTPQDEQARDDSAWVEYEFWALTRNPNVRRIWRVDPTDVRAIEELPDEVKCHWNDPVIEWDRDHHQPLPPKKYCSIKYAADGEPWATWGEEGEVIGEPA